MDFIKDITKKVGRTAKTAVKKSNNLLEITKLNMSIGSEEDKIAKIYTQIGKEVYDSFENNAEASEKFNVLCEKISIIKANIERMEKQILRIKNIKMCPECGAQLEITVCYCSGCGTKQESPTVYIEEMPADADVEEEAGEEAQEDGYEEPEGDGAASETDWVNPR